MNEQNQAMFTINNPAKVTDQNPVKVADQIGETIRHHDSTMSSTFNQGMIFDEDETVTEQIQKTITNQNSRMSFNLNERMIFDEEETLTDEIEETITNQNSRMSFNLNERMIFDEEETVTDQNEFTITDQIQEMMKNKNSATSTILNDRMISDEDDPYENNVYTIKWVRAPCGNHKPVCDDSLKPVVGMTFSNLASGIDFYKQYAKACGFVPRLGTQKKSHDGGILLKYILCAKEGELIQKDNNEDQELVQYTKRKCVTTRTGCKAMISLKMTRNKQYTVSKFNELHNHPFFTQVNYQYLRSNRRVTREHKDFIMNCTRATVGPTKAHNVFSNIVGGQEHVGATDTDFRNFERQLKVYIQGSDVQIVINDFFKEQEYDPDFYFEYDQDECNRLTRLFWTDGVARRNYQRYGDSVSFDSTYGSNRYLLVFCPFTGIDNHEKSVTFGAGLISQEDAPSFVWLFNCFKRAMRDKQPLCIITDQDRSIKNGIAEVFPDSKHRLCMWHIMQKLPPKVEKDTSNPTEFLKRLRSIVWTRTLEREEFDSCWQSLLAEFGLENHSHLQSLFKIRAHWIPAYFKDYPMAMLMRTTSRSESANSAFGCDSNQALTLFQFMGIYNMIIKKQRNEHMKMVTQYAADARPTSSAFSKLELHAWDVYSRTIYNKVRVDLKNGVLNYGIHLIEHEEHHNIYTIFGKDKDKSMNKVTMGLNTKHCQCTCKTFEGFGRICTHIFAALNAANVNMLPRTLINERWCREPPELLALGEFGGVSKRTNKDDNIINIEIWTALQSILGNPATTYNQRESLLQYIRDQQNVGSSSSASSSNSRPISIEEISGIPKPPVVQVHIPNVCKNKGQGRRSRSEREKAIEKANKRKKKEKVDHRRCGYCKEIGPHNATTCGKRKRDEEIAKVGGSHS